MAYGEVYYVDLTPTAVTVAVDLAELTPADDRPIEIIGGEIFQTSDFGDAQEEGISLVWVRGHTTSGSGGSAPTPRPARPNAAAAGFTAETFNTTPASVGTTVNLPRHGFNVRVPTPLRYIPEEMPEAGQGNTTLVLRMAAAPADSLTISGYIAVRERA